MMRSREVAVGVSVSAEAVHAILMRHGQVAAWAEVVLTSNGTLEDALIGVLRDVTSTRVSRVRVYASVGPQYAQVRDVGEMGWAKDRALARSIVAENPGRFFLVNGIPIATTEVQHAGDEHTWVGAIEQPVVDALISACGALGVELVLVAPAAAVLGHATSLERIVWRDGDVAAVATYDQARLSSYRRIRREDLGSEQDRAIASADELPTLGPDTERFAAALGAARARGSIELAVRARPNAARARARLRLAALCCAAAVVSAILIPPLINLYRANRARAGYLRIARSAEQTFRTEQEVNDGARTLNELNQFARGRRSSTLLLASLTNAIEPPAMVLSLQADTLGGTLVALAPRAAALITMLDSVPEIADSRITGAVTRELAAPTSAQLPTSQSGTSAAVPMERVSVRFMWRRHLGRT